MMANHKFPIFQILLIGIVGLASAMAQVGDREFVVSIRATGSGEAAKAASLGAGGVLFVIEDPTKDTSELIRALCAETKRNGLKLWIGTRSLTKVRHLKLHEAVGMALIFPPQEGEPARPDDFDSLMENKRRGDRLGAAIRQIRREFGSNKGLAICVDHSAIDPETAADMYVPVRDLVRDGTVDLVCLSGVERFNFHRLRLLRDTPLCAGAFLDGRSTTEKARAGLVSRGVLAAIENDTCECLWIANLPIDLVGRVVTDTVDGYKRNKAQREAIDRAIEEKELVVDQGIPEKARNNQATVHGVAQSFVPSRDGGCPLIQIYAAIRGCRGPLPPALQVEIRTDEGGRPAGNAIATAAIPAAEFGHEPAYRWGSAHLGPPVGLKKNMRYWIYLPNASRAEGTYVWGIAGDGANERGNAWSCRYDYAKHSWVFRVYLAEETPR